MFKTGKEIDKIATEIMFTEGLFGPYVDREEGICISWDE